MRSPHSPSRLHLPIDDVQGQILELILDNETSIVIGETGCGKSTQIPQICLRAPLSGQIAVTQPRRVAAVSLASRVASEMNSVPGDKVGYRVRFENNTSAETSIVYMTDGILLREAIHDGLLLKYSIVIVDEAHERSLHTDVLLSILRLAQKQRRAGGLDPLKIIIMSATLHSGLFSKFFDSAPVYLIKGRTFPVEIFYAEALDSDQSDYLYNAIVTVIQVHRQDPITDDILVFLTGQEEIETACKRLRDLNKELQEKMHVVPLYAALKPVSQQKVFDPAPEGMRKVILATNIAETSLTIPGVRVVIDCGKVKQRTYNPTNRTDVLRVESISKAQSNQRAGRAGREASGKCFRLFSRTHFDRMRDSPIAEILRSNLSSVVLELVAMGLKKVCSLRWLEEPSEELVEGAVRQLRILGAVKEGKKERLELTDKGRIMAQFPVEVEYARVLLAAQDLGCLDEALIVVAAMSGEGVLSLSREEKSAASARLHTMEGDHLSMLNAFRVYYQERKRKNKMELTEWTTEAGLNLRALVQVQKVRKQMKEIADKNKLKVVSAGAERELIRKALAIGLFMNACELDREKDCYRMLVSPSVTLRIHPSSCIATSRPSCFVFSQLLRTTDLFAKDITLIDRSWVEDLVADAKKRV